MKIFFVSFTFTLFFVALAFEENQEPRGKLRSDQISEEYQRRIHRGVGNEPSEDSPHQLADPLKAKPEESKLPARLERSILAENFEYLDHKPYFNMVFYKRKRRDTNIMHQGTFLQPHTQQGDLELITEAAKEKRENVDNKLSLSKNLDEKTYGSRTRKAITFYQLSDLDDFERSEIVGRLNGRQRRGPRQMDQNQMTSSTGQKHQSTN